MDCALPGAKRKGTMLPLGRYNNHIMGKLPLRHGQQCAANLATPVQVPSSIICFMQTVFVLAVVTTKLSTDAVATMASESRWRHVLFMRLCPGCYRP